jgi:mono/diheme cytochrome c family protein
MLFRFSLALFLSSTSLFSAQTKDLKAFYQRSCAACHGQDGSGRSAAGQKLGGRPLNDPKWQAHEKDSELVKSILKGEGSMPAYESQLTEQEALKLVQEVIRPMAARKK